MPKPETIAKNKKPAKRGINFSRLQVDQDKITTLEVPLGEGETMVIYSRDMSVKTIRQFTDSMQGDVPNFSLMVSAFMGLASDWGTIDDDGNYIPIPDADGEPWPLTEENVNTLDLAVFQAISGELGKLG